MAYVYDSVVASLGGKPLVSNTREGVTVKGWSPNMFKRVAILTDGIVVEYHGTVSRSRVIPFDLVKVSEDLASGGKYKNPLRPIFEFKALSCLEELIVSSSLVTDSMVKNYLSTVSDSHRIRQVGVVPLEVKTSDISGLIEKLNAQEGGRHLLISDFISGASKVSTKNEDYYTKYYLRPTYYELDKQGGSLRKYFDTVKEEVQAKRDEGNKSSLLSSYLAYDKKNIRFWNSVVTFLSKKENASKYPQLYSNLKSHSMANAGCYLEGLKEYFEANGTSEPIYKVYKVLGYLDTKGSTRPSSEAKGFLRKLESVANNAYPLVLEVVKKDKEGLLRNLKLPKDSDRSFIVYTVLETLNSETVGTDNEKVESDLRTSEGSVSEREELLREGIEALLPESLMVGLFDLWEALQDDYKETAGMLLSARGRDFGYRFSERALRDLGLDRHAETLSLLGYCGGSDDLENLGKLTFSDPLSSLCHMVTRNSLAELRAKPWESLSDTDKCDYIVRRIN